MRLWRSRLSRLTERLDEITKQLDRIEQFTERLNSITERMDHIERLARGGRIAYLGNGRLVVGANLGGVDFAFLVEADDLLITPEFAVRGIHEAEITNYLIRELKSDSNCVDIGANFGYYTCIMARWAHQGKTIAIEPQANMFELLRDNIYVHALQEVAEPRRAAAGAEAGTLTLYRRITRSGNTSILRADWVPEVLGEPKPEPFTIECVPVDQLLPDFSGRIDYMKIDVEGAEPLVIAGATVAIDKNPNIKIIMEWDPPTIQACGFDAGDFVRRLQSMNLNGAVIREDGPEPASWDALLSEHYLPGILLERTRD